MSIYRKANIRKYLLSASLVISRPVPVFNAAFGDLFDRRGDEHIMANKVIFLPNFAMTEIITILLD